MTAPKRIFGASEIALMFDVSRACVSNWTKRYENCPKPDFVQITNKVERGYYLEHKLDEWLEWHRTTINSTRSVKAQGRNYETSN